MSDRLNAFAPKDDDDDDYYLAIGSEPPRFRYYRQIRAEKWKALGHKPLLDEDYDHSITQEELDFILKRELWPSSEERYQHEKRNPGFSMNQVGI